MLRIAVVTGSTRPGRKSRRVAEWTLEIASAREDASFELVDIADFDLPLYDEPFPAMAHKYTQEHTKRWSQAITPFDGFVFATPEYNHATSAALKNAIDYLGVEWVNKAAGFVSWGSSGGVRAVENLRLILANLQVATVRNQVALNTFTDWRDGDLAPADIHLTTMTAMLDQLVSWSGALKTLR